MNKKAIILLSGGLDSLVALDIISKECDVVKSLTFDYGQKSAQEEILAAKKIAKEYNIDNEVIELQFLKEITNNALTNEANQNFGELKSVWVPNRNGLFLNIAACYCDSKDIDFIAFGANKEESGSFSDNRNEYVELTNSSFEYSTLKKPIVIAPCSNMNKIDLVNYMIDNNIDFDLIKSCYRNEKETNKKHCGECMSCKLLYNAILNSKKPELIKEVF
ncbi:MAG: 7-cyano-7-deazaguanine synthase QueC [Candidatus Gastranaerophilales bacterium]|nr:7-cyano-7-deazaguanine synthase QueC [Candidatus Gastranaerophilales bacterium]